MTSNVTRSLPSCRQPSRALIRARNKKSPAAGGAAGIGRIARPVQGEAPKGNDSRATSAIAQLPSDILGNVGRISWRGNCHLWIRDSWERPARQAPRSESSSSQSRVALPDRSRKRRLLAALLDISSRAHTFTATGPQAQRLDLQTSG